MNFSYETWELIAFILYFACVLGVGIFFMLKSKNGGAEEYFLGGRKMGPWVTALSAQASDMSGWLLMGFPGTILALGFGQVWIAIGLALGTYANWRIVAARLRRFSKAAGDSITVPEYLANRFKAKNHSLQVISATIFFVCFTVYVASSFKAGGELFSTVLGIDSSVAMIIFGLIIIAYTFTGGFQAVCWTDFFQAILMLFAITIIPIVVMATQSLDFSTVTTEMPNYFNLLPSGKFDWESISSILSGLAWGLGYFGMPHIIVRFMAIKNSKMIKKSRKIAITWVVITLAAACVIGAVGRAYMPELAVDGQEMVFINMVRAMCPGLISGILLSAILAASMSTADSQLLVASSAFTKDFYKPILRKDASNKEMLWVGRGVVLAIAIVAYFIAVNPSTGGIMDLVENAWAGFGASFGPAIILSLYWKRFTYKGAIAGIVCGAATVVIWIMFFSASTGLYELLPGFIVGMTACVVGSLLDKEPSEEIVAVYETAMAEDFED